MSLSFKHSLDNAQLLFDFEETMEDYDTDVSGFTHITTVIVRDGKDIVGTVIRECVVSLCNGKALVEIEDDSDYLDVEDDSIFDIEIPSLTDDEKVALYNEFYTDRSYQLGFGHCSDVDQCKKNVFQFLKHTA